jgi:hypothetical protein
VQQAAALNAKARRAAKRVGLRAVKSRLHKGSVDNRGGFMLNDPFRNTPVAGRRFDLEPKDVNAICKEYAPTQVFGSGR